MTLFPPYVEASPMRVAIYARVSTDDKGQDPENQLRELRDWVNNSGHIISQEYVDYDSGWKGAEKRKQFAALFEDAAKRKFDCVLFWALDRLSREGTRLHWYDLVSHCLGATQGSCNGIPRWHLRQKT